MVRYQGTSPTFKIIPNTNSHIKMLRPGSALSVRESGKAVSTDSTTLSDAPTMTRSTEMPKARQKLVSLMM